MRTHVLALLVTACGAPARPAATSALQPGDPARHAVQRVAVAPDVSLEVLDFGGSGEPIVLLAGLGNTAHVFDDFAPRLVAATGRHTVAVTRRGFGASSGPADGYDLATRVADDVAVADALHLARAVWIGHSIAGDELTGLAATHPDRAAALVYIDAANEHTPRALSVLDGAPDYRPPLPPPETVRDAASLTAARNAAIDVPFPVGEAAGQFEFTPRGPHPRGNPDAADKILAADAPQDFTAVHVPALVLLAVPSSAGEMIHGFSHLSAADQQAWHDTWWAVHTKMVDDTRADVVAHLAGAKIIEYPHGYHFLFLTSADQALADVSAFVAR